MDAVTQNAINALVGICREGKALGCYNDRGQHLNLGRGCRKEDGIIAEFEVSGRPERVRVVGLTPEQAVALHGAFCLLSDAPEVKIYDQIGG